MARTGPSFVRFIESIEITNAGNGYSSSDPPVVYISPPNLTSTEGDKVQATATIAISSNRVDSITITNPGDGYATAPTVKLAGSLHSVTFTAQTDENRGSGTFTNVTGIGINGGTGALFTVVVDGAGAVTSVTVTTSGSNYVEGDVITIPDTNLGGTGAAADVTVTVATISGGGSGAVLTPTINYLNRPQRYFHQNFSYLVDSQIPEWIRNEYPTYTAFIKKYFEFLDAGNETATSLGMSSLSPNYLLQELLDRLSVTHYHDDFVNDLASQYGIDFPDEKEIDTRYLIKHLREFYTSKGSQESIKTLFRILYNEEIDIFKPSEFILRPSDGIWTREVTVKVYENDEYLPIYNPLDLRGRNVFVYFYESTGSLTSRKHISTSVLRAKKIAYTNPSAYELTLNLPAETDILGYGVEGDLTAVIGGEISTVTNIGAADVLRDNAGSPYTITSGFTTDGNGTGAEFTITVDGSGAASVVVDDGGDNYAPGETITIPDSLLGSGGAADLTFDIDDIINGKIFSVTIANSGQGYSANPIVNVLPHADDTITTDALVYTRLTDGEITSILIGEGGVGYNNTPLLVLNTQPYRTYLGFENTIDSIENKKAFLTRVLNEVYVSSTSGAPDGGFKIGDTFLINETGDILGIYAVDYFAEDYTITGITNNAFVRVTSLDANNYPALLEIVATGVGFQRFMFTITLNSATSESIVLACTTGFSHTYPGQFKNSRGFLSDANRLQNNALYSPYSYQIQSSLPKSRWGEILKRTAHPAGMSVYSDLQILQTVDYSANIDMVPDRFFFYKTFLEEYTVNDSPALFFSRPDDDSISVSDENAVEILTTLFKFEIPSAIDDVNKFDVTMAKSENPDMSELVEKDIRKPAIADSVELSEVVILLLQILRDPIDSVDMSETVALVIELNKTENPIVDDIALLTPNLIKAEIPLVNDNDTLTVGPVKNENPDMTDNLLYLFGSTQSESYEVSEAGQLIVQNYAGDYFAEDYVGEVRNF